MLCLHSFQKKYLKKLISKMNGRGSVELTLYHIEQTSKLRLNDTSRIRSSTQNNKV